MNTPALPTTKPASSALLSQLPITSPPAPANGTPLVSVVTPFYNTADYLAECIESVLAQTYTNFEYVLVNNYSTDGSREIAEKYAREDSRIRLFNNPSFLTQVANYNRALELITPDSQFTKIVQADDKVFPTCLSEMVRVATSHPTVGIIGSFAMRGRKVILDGFPFDSEVVSGLALCREQLLTRKRHFASPTSVMFRSDIVRTRQPFYDESLLHEDTEACFDILLSCDFAFVSQVLTFLRCDNDSIMNKIKDFDPQWSLLDHLIVTHRFGRRVLTNDEFQRCWKAIESEYLSHLGRSFFQGRDSQFWDRHRLGAETIGYTPSRAKLLYSATTTFSADLARRIVSCLKGPIKIADFALMKAFQRQNI